VGRATLLGPGNERQEIAARTSLEITALALANQRLVLGDRRGSLEWISLAAGSGASGAGAPGAPASFEDLPAAAVTRLALGPAGTVAAGFEDGHLGLWDLASGVRLVTERLHGAVLHLQQNPDGSRLLAASELGSHVTWDLRALLSPRCELLRQVWQQVPVVWEGGRPVARDPPAGHPCAD
jgi:hypothetical protein